MNATMCPWCGDKYEARAWDAPHECKEDIKMIISTFCQECDIDLYDIEGEYQKVSNVMSYTCTKCGSEQDQQGWEEK